MDARCILFPVTTKLKGTALVLIALCTLSGCRFESVRVTDIDEMTSNQLENNKVGIDRIRQELKGFSIDHLAKNVELVNYLDQRHAQILQLFDTMDVLDDDIAARHALSFINSHLADLDFVGHLPLDIDINTPPALIKLHVADLEAFSLNQRRGKYKFVDEPRISLDSVIVRILPDKEIVRKGEKITGRLVLGAEADNLNSRKAIRRLMLNGTEISATKDGWLFEVTPTGSASGPFLLECDLLWYDGKTTLRDQRYVS